MKRITELMCAWGGIAFLVLFVIGFVGIARFFPPMSPADTAEQTAALYREHHSTIIAGLVIAFVGTMCFLAFGSGIVGQTRRIRGVAPAITYFQVSSYASALTLIILPLTCWFTAAFRPETRSAESIQLINDFGWITFVIGFPPFVTWVFATGLAILSDRSNRPLYPRWAGYLSLCMGLIQGIALLLPFFKVGPFAWDGLFSWYIPFSDFFLWFLVITMLTIKAINKPEYEDDAAAELELVEPPYPRSDSVAMAHVSSAGVSSASRDQSGEGQQD